VDGVIASMGATFEILCTSYPICNNRYELPIKCLREVFYLVISPTKTHYHSIPKQLKKTFIRKRRLRRIVFNLLGTEKGLPQ